ncbi:SPL family radical SAM protein [Cohnella kolymensis]|nr:radical SAM protein [Cohnella kolymensis]
MMNHTRYEPLRPKTVLNPVRSPSMPFDWSINPYRGCQHGCSFCYARSTHSYVGETADDAFQKHIYWKEDAPEVLRDQLKRMKGRLPRHVTIGTATDPYQQLEGKEKLTRGCLEVLNEFNIPVGVTTRSPLILRDLDLLQSNPASFVNFSCHTMDSRIWREFEPSTPSPRRRMDTLRKLNEAGVSAGVFIAPILPYLTDSPESTESVIAECREANAQFVMFSPLRLSTPEVKSWFFSVLERNYPELTEAYGRLYWRSSSAPESYRKPLKSQIVKQLADYGLSAKDIQPDTKPSRYNQQQPAAESCAPVQLTLF